MAEPTGNLAPDAPAAQGVSVARAAFIGDLLRRFRKGERKPKSPYTPGTPNLDEGPSIEGLKSGAEIAKQLITLSVAMLGLTITFLRDIVGLNASGVPEVSTALAIAWGAYLLCILAAIATMQGICGAMTVLDQKAMALNHRPGHDGSYDVYATTVRWPMTIMIVSFLIAISCTVVSAATAKRPAGKSQPSPCAPPTP